MPQAPARMFKFNSLTLGAVVLLGGLALWQFLEISELKKSNAALSQQVQTAPVTTMTSAAFPAAKNAGPVLDKEMTATESPSAAAQTPEQAARSAQFKKMRVMDRTQRHDAKILALTTKLNLTPEQQTAVRSALEKGSAERDAIRDAADGRRRAGKVDTEEQRQGNVAEVARIEANQEETIVAGMSGDQLAAYSAYQTEQKQATVESRANQQLGDLTNKFSLTEEQKEAAFQFFAGQEEEQGSDPALITAAGAAARTVFEQRLQTQLEGMKQILTPEQFELYSAQQAQRSAMFGDMTPGGPRGRP